MLVSTQTPKTQNPSNLTIQKMTTFLQDIRNNTYFEYDDDVNEYCAFFNGLDGYYGQGETKDQALAELLSSYFDTCNL